MNPPIDDIRRAVNEARQYCADYGTINDGHLDNVQAWLDSQPAAPEWSKPHTVPPLTDAYLLQSDWVEVKARAFWYEESENDFGWVIDYDTLQWRILPAQGEGGDE